MAPRDNNFRAAGGGDSVRWWAEQGTGVQAVRQAERGKSMPMRIHFFTKATAMM